MFMTSRHPCLMKSLLAALRHVVRYDPALNPVAKCMTGSQRVAAEAAVRTLVENVGWCHVFRSDTRSRLADGHLVDDNVLLGSITAVGGRRGDRVDHVHARRDLAEDRVR